MDSQPANDASETAAAELRKRAEEIVRANTARAARHHASPQSPEETQRLFHELQVHQVELEMQNEEMRRAQSELDAARARYFDLYDLAPVGYCTVSDSGIILEANLTAAALLGVTRSALIHQAFARFITKPEQDAYCQHHRQSLISKKTQVCELQMARANGTFFWAHMETGTARLADGATVLRIILGDISEHRREAVELARNQAELQAVYNNAPVMMCVVNADMRVLYANAAMSAFTGVPTDMLKNRSAGDTFSCVNALDDPRGCGFGPKCRSCALHLAMADTLMAGTTHSSIEHGAMLVRDGKLQTLTLLCSTALIEEQNRSRLLLCMYDITDRKRAEEALKASARQNQRQRELFQEIANVMPDMVWAKDLDRNFIFVNKAVCEGLLCAKDTSEPIGKGDLFFVGRERESHPGDPQWHTFGEICLDSDAVVLESGTTGRFDEFGNVRGKFLALDVIKTPLWDEAGKIIGTVGSGRDVTAHRQAEAALRESERLLRESQHAGSMGSYALDIAGGLWRSSDELELIFGIAPAHEHTMDEWTALVHPADRAMMVAYLMNEVCAQGHAFNKAYRIIRHSDHAERWVHGMGNLEFDGQGHPVKMHGTIQDITERKLAEDERLRLEVQLQQAQKMESVGRLAGGVAHDFNNMLSVILGHAEMAMVATRPGQPIYADLDEIRKAAQRSADLTRQLLAFARKQTIMPQVLDLNEIVAGMLKMLTRLIGEDILLLWQPGADLFTLKMDPSQLDQILANLCVNARDSITDVGRIIIETGNESFSDADGDGRPELVPGEYVRLTVSDNGCGMDQETMSHLFEPFFTTKAVGVGTGLGLATVYGAIRQNNGFVSVCSEPGMGTKFNIYLPRYTGDKAAQAQPSTPLKSADTGGQETILLVEDEPGILKLITRMLEHQGYTVLAADTPEEALRLARKHTGTIHLLVTDVVMPGMNGRDLAQSLHALNPHLRTIFMSGYTADIIARHGVMDEGMYFIQKPFPSQVLTAKIREVLNNGR